VQPKIETSRGGHGVLEQIKFISKPVFCLYYTLQNLKYLNTLHVLCTSSSRDLASTMSNNRNEKSGESDESDEVEIIEVEVIEVSSDESDKANESDDANESDESDKANESDESDKANESDESDKANESPLDPPAREVEKRAIEARARTTARCANIYPSPVRMVIPNTGGAAPLDPPPVVHTAAAAAEARAAAAEARAARATEEDLDYNALTDAGRAACKRAKRE
jgi:hypothetical protein